MSRIPSFLDPRRTSPDSVGVASATMPIPALGQVPVHEAPSGGGAELAGVAFAGRASADVLAEMGERRVIAQRARTLTDFESNALMSVDQAMTAADQLDPGVAEAGYVQHESIGALRDQLRSIKDVDTRIRAEAIFTDYTDRGRIAVARRAATREAESGRASNMRLADEFSARTRSGELDAAVAAGELGESVKRHIGSAFTADSAQSFMDSSRQRFYREQASLILNGTSTVPPRPESMAEFLEREDTVEALSPGEREALARAATLKLDERNGQLIINAMSQASQELDKTLALEGANSAGFIEVAQRHANTIAEMPAVRELRNRGEIVTGPDEVMLALLSDPMEAAARAGDIDRFAIVASALPGATLDEQGRPTGSTNSDASILYSVNLDRLREAVGQADRAAITEARVQDAISNGWRLESNQQNQAAVDRDASGRIQTFVNENPNGTPDDIGRMLIDTYGPTTLLPTQLVQAPTAVAQNPEAFKPGDVQYALDLLTYARSKFPRAYEVSYDADIRAFHRTYLQMQLPGANVTEVAQAAHDALNPKDVATAEQINATAGPLATFAMSQFASFAGTDPLFGVDLEADIAVERLFSMEGETPRLRMDAFSDLVPAEMVQRYLDYYFLNMKKGSTKEAASADAWERVVDAGYSATRVFQRTPVVRAMTPERMYGSESYDWREIELDLANRIGLDDVDAHIIWPGVIEQPGELAFPKSTERVPIQGVTFRPPTPISPEFLPLATPDVQIDLGDGTTARAVRESYMRGILDYARDRLALVPAGDENGGNVVEVAPGVLKPLYQVNYRDRHGRLHPLFQRQVNPATGQEETVPYMLAPIEAEGISKRYEERLRNLNQKKEMLRIKRRSEASESFLRNIRETEAERERIERERAAGRNVPFP